jgi:hypothetical protein
MNLESRPRPNTTGPTASGKVIAAAIYASIAVTGIAAFSWPFWIATTRTDGHTADAWIWAALISGLAVGAVAFELARTMMTAAGVAVLGALAAMTGLLRIVDLPGGGSGMFFLLILAAAAFGARAGVLLAFAAMATGAVVTGGVGPWLPFQMLALAVVGVGAGVLGRGTRRLNSRVEVAVLATYGFGAAFAYGLVINLWDWPLRPSAGSDISFAPALGIGDTLRSYWRFYTTTSLAWDGAGALANAIIIVIVGRQTLHALRRVERRITPAVHLDDSSFRATVGS